MIKTSQPALHGDQHLPDGSDPIPGFPPSLGTGDTLDNTILGLAPAGFWKLNESSGSVAADSSGNGFDLTADTGPPIWGNAAGPPGEQTADFETGTSSYPPPSGTLARVARTWAAQTGSFTVGVWVKRNDTTFSNVMGQGNPSRAGGNGWAIEIYNPSTGAGNRILFAVVNNSGVSSASVESTNPFLADVWAFVAGTYNADTDVAKLYVDGVLQGTSSTLALVMSSNPLWIGHDGGLGGNAYQGCFCTLSYAFLFPVALTGAEILDINDHAGTTGFLESGLVLTSNGFGASSWEEPTIRVTY